MRIHGEPLLEDFFLYQDLSKNEADGLETLPLALIFMLVISRGHESCNEQLKKRNTRHNRVLILNPIYNEDLF